MARKKLLVKSEEGQPRLKKKLKVKEDNLLPLGSDVYASHTLITDNQFFISIVPDTEDFLGKLKISANDVKSFPWEDVDLQLEFNRKEPLDVSDDGMIESMGKIDQYNWLKLMYPSCEFYQITKWLGKNVNTLVIVLAEEHGKPVAIVKTIE
jgi:hypothetical protein